MNINKNNLLLTCLTLSSVITNLAQAKSVNVHEFSASANPAYILSEDALSSSNWGSTGQGRPFFSAYYDMVNDPLVELDSRRTKRTALLVDSIHSLNLTFGYNFYDWMQAGAAISLSMVKLPDATSQFGLGDTRVFTKFRLNSTRDPIVFAIMPELYAPTGNKNLYLSDSSLGAGVHFIAEHDFGPLTATANAGLRHNPNAEFRDLNKRTGIPLSLSLLIPVSSKWAVNTEAGGEISVPSNRYQNPMMLYAGARYRLPSDFILSFGGAVGAFDRYSSADFRIIAGITLMPQTKTEFVAKELPKPAPVVASVAPEPKARVIWTEKEITLNEEVKFEHNQAVLTRSGQTLLDEVASVIKSHDNAFDFIMVEGHTNEIGSDRYNLKLSQRRAAAVKEYLVSRGIKPAHLHIIGFGESRPKLTAASGLSRDAILAANRRVEFKIMSNGQLKNSIKIKTQQALSPATTSPATQDALPKSEKSKLGDN